MNHFLAIVPSILALIAFVLVIRLMVNSDRIERRAEAKFDAQMKAEEAAKAGGDIENASGTESETAKNA
ncbi:MAG: hypothetical protein Q4P33_06735 [Flaviflexus sp.]|nr:hypothetical protein [Flaviflexus sp.]